ncbi:MAG: hypothetical protein R2771_06600 [Saprospiraceae bacterium]
MNIQSEKIAIVKLILDTDNPDILKSIRNLFKKQEKIDFWNTLTENQKEDIEKGISEIEGGDTVKYEEFMRRHR